MMGRVVSALLVLAGFQLMSSLAYGLESSPTDADFEAIDTAIEAARLGRCDDSLPYLQTVEISPSFAEYPDDSRIDILRLIVYCLSLAEKTAETGEYLKTLVFEEGEETPGLLRLLVWPSILNDELAVGVEAVKRLATYGRHELQVLSNETYFYLYVPLLNAGNLEDLRYDFLRTFFLSEYEPGNPFEFADEFMFDYAVMSVERGDVTDLKKIIRSLTEPGVILRVRIDRRFDAVRKDGDLEDFLDLENASDRYISKLEGLITTYPQFAFGHVLLSRALTGAWRFKDALDAIEPIAWKVRIPIVNRSFTDLDTSKNWVLETYANAMWREEYPEQSEDMFIEAVQVPESNEKNVSQQINLALKVIHGGNLDLALALAQDLLDSNANTSPYGAMWIRTILVCGNAMSDAPKDFSQSMAYLLAHERDNPGALIEALLCTNDLDLAAQHLIRRLESVVQRTNALLYMQYTKSDWESERRAHVHQHLDELSAGHILWHRLDEVRERDDVVAAANQVGRIEVVPLNSLVWHRY